MKLKSFLRPSLYGVIICAVYALCAVVLCTVHTTAWAYDSIIVPSDEVPIGGRVVVASPKRPAPATGWPSLYLLNGFQGGEKDWTRRTDLDSIADARGLVIVCPDGGNLWYWDTPKARMESYITGTLVAAVDSLYSTARNPRSRTIGGLSMGGHGAMWLGARHPEVFGAIASMSGGLDVTSKACRNKFQIPALLGRYEANPQAWADHSAMSVIPSLGRNGQRIFMICGIDDFLYADNVAFDKALDDARIPHTFITRPGVHDWVFWKAALPLVVDFAMEY